MNWQLSIIRAVHRGVSFPLKLLAGFFAHRTVRAVLRVSLLLTVLAVVLAALGIRSAKGDLGEQTLVIGRQLAKLEDLTRHTTRLSINEQPIHVASAVVDAPLADVLDRYQAVCESESPIGDEFIDPKTIVMRSPGGGKAFAFGALRNETEVDGVIACITKPDPNDERSFTDRLKQFTESRDFGDLGSMRYAYAQRTETGRTHVITVWTDGAFDLDSLMPPVNDVDAPGSDAPGVVRPPDSVRYLTAAAAGHPHSVRLYESKRPVSEVLAFYDRELPARGWRALPEVDAELETGRFFVKDGVLTMVFVGQHEGRVSVSLVQTPE